MDLKPYLSYKDSGFERLGEVPEHWDARRLKQACRLAYGDSLAHDVRQDGAIPVFGSNGGVGCHHLANTMAPCIVVGRKGSFGKVNYSDIPVFAIDTTFFIDDRFSSNHMRWLYFLLGSLRLDEVTKDSAVPGLDREDAYQRLAPIPPLPEQTAIARFLDHTDRSIRRYIHAKEKLIALLEEQKQALIQEAVTGQIDVQKGKPYPAYKDSGVDWLGEVPKHWEVTRTRFLVKEVDVRSSTGKETHLSMSQVLGLVPSQMVDRTLTSNSYIGGKLCENGDLVLNRLKAHLGVFALARQPGVISPDYSVFRKRKAAQMEYFEQVFRLPALRTELRIRAKGIVEGFWRLYTRDLFDIRLPVPSLPEQGTIAKYVAEKVLSVDDNIFRARREIELLREYRTRLITDVVTGKLDVREAAAAVPYIDPLDTEDGLNNTLNAGADTEFNELDAIKEAAKE